MANKCANQLVVIGPLRDLSDFKGRSCNFKSAGDTEVDLDMEKLVPLSAFASGAPFSYFENQDRIDKAWGCSWVSNVKLKFTDSGEGYGCLEFSFVSAWTPPEMFVKHASMIFPRLEFYLAYMEEGVGFAGVVIYAAGRQEEEVNVRWLDAKKCLNEYVARPRPGPWDDGLFDDPDAPKPNHKTEATDRAGGTNPD